MKLSATAIKDVLILEPQIFGDHRGYFMETWRKSQFSEAGISQDFVQDNQSKSSQGILRGLHYQLEKPQGKLIRAIAGEIYDVAVDLRRSSATFGQWVGVTLSADNNKQLWVPPGFAHGFYVVSKTAEIVYKCTAYYAPSDEHSLLWNDSELNIDWPVTAPPTLSEKDQQGNTLQQAETYP